MKEIPWSYSALRPKFFNLDAIAVFPVTLWLVHMSKATLCVAFLCILILIVFNFLGIPASVMGSYLRAFILGPIRPAVERNVFRHRSKY